MNGTYSMHGSNTKCSQNLVEKREGKKPLARLDIDGRIILKRILKKWGLRVWTRFN
jgi:hypothetical protein